MDVISLNSRSHNSNLVNSLDHFKAVNSFVDVTLVCEGHTVKAHKIVLSAGSNVLHRLLLANPAKHPIIILTETKYDTLRMMMDFLYKGKIDIAVNDLKKLLTVAVTFEINELKILCEESLANQRAYNTPNIDSCPQSPNLNGSSPKRKRQCTQSSDYTILYDGIFPKREVSSPIDLEEIEVSTFTDTFSESAQTECVEFHPQIADTRSLNRTSVESSTETVASNQSNQKKDASTECDLQPLKELESNLVPTETTRVIARPRRIEIIDMPDDPKKLQNRRKRSKIWGYYTNMSDSYAACKLCGKKLSYKTTVSNLKKHLQKSHKQFDPLHPPRLPDVPVLRLQSNQLELFEEIDFNSVEEEIAAEEEVTVEDEDLASDDSIPSTLTPCILKIT